MRFSPARRGVPGGRHLRGRGTHAAAGGGPAAEAAIPDHDAPERAPRDPLRGSLDADRARLGGVSRRLEERARRGAPGFAHLFEHMMFKGSRNVEPESHTSLISSVGGRSNAYTTEDETVFWQTFPAHYLPLVAVARGRSDGDAARRRRGVPARAGGRQGRAADADREPAVRPALGDHLRQRLPGASLQAPDDREHGGSGSGVDRGRARLPQHLLRAGKRHRDDRRRLRSRRRRCSW